MKRMQTPFFATKNDLQEVCKSALSGLDVKMVECGLFDSDQVNEVLYPFDVVEHKIYIILSSLDKVVPRVVEQRRGGVKFALDSLGKENSPVIRVGGMVASSILLPGDISRMSDHVSGEQDYFSIIEKNIKKNFKKIKNYFVGREAIAFLDNGGRLAVTANSPIEYDLKR